MNKVIEIIRQLQNTSGTNDKIQILKDNKDNELLKKVLIYTYDDKKKYGVSKTNLKKILENDIYFNYEPLWNNGFEMLEELSKSNINDSLRARLKNFLNSLSDDEKDLWCRVLTKDLKIGLKVKSINKAIPNLIYEFCMQRAKPINDKTDRPKEGEWFALMIKHNGERGIYIDNIINSRQNKEFLGLDHLKNELKILSDNGYYVIDGELQRYNYDNIPDGENFRLTSSILSDESGKYDKKEIHMYIFDMIPTEEFKSGESKLKAKNRIENLKQLENKIRELGLKYVHICEILYEGTDQNKIDEYLQYVDKELKLEGMVLYRDKTYKCTKNNHILKVKEFKYSDLEIVGTYQGKVGGKYENTLGGIICKYKNNTVKSGGGEYLTDEMRDYWWEHRDELIGRIAELKYKEETKDSKTGLPSIQFPQWNRLREVGKEISYES